MNPGFIKCPLCNRPVRLVARTGQMTDHYASFARVGSGFHGLSDLCKGSRRKPEDVAK
jgi:hypothetical protein